LVIGAGVADSFSSEKVCFFSNRTLAEDREVEGLARPEPDHVRRVIRKIVSGFSVGEDGEVVPIKDRPGRKLPKSLPGDRELTATARMRPDGALVEAADGNPEQGPRFGSERLGGTQFVGIEIDMGVEVSEIAHAAKIVLSVRRSRAEVALDPSILVIMVTVAVASALVLVAATLVVAIDPALNIAFAIAGITIGIDDALAHNAVVRRAVGARIRGLTLRLGRSGRQRRGSEQDELPKHDIPLRRLSSSSSGEAEPSMNEESLSP
jgi:hypothetical protein